MVLKLAVAKEMVINLILFEYFKFTRSNNVIISRPIFQEKTLEFGRMLHPETTFIASNSWAKKIFGSVTDKILRLKG